MKSTTVLAGLNVETLGARVFGVGELRERLEGLHDLRQRKGRRYDLATVLVLIVLAKLSGEDQPSGIASWIALRQSQLSQVLALNWERMPQHNTMAGGEPPADRRILAWAIDSAEFDRVVTGHLQQLTGVGRSVLVSLDGKTVRGTIDADNPRGEHLLALYLPEEGIVLAQEAAESHENEIVAAPRLLKGVNLRRKVVMGDAMQTQREFTLQILAAKANYIWFVKDNQHKLHDSIETLFAPDQPTVLATLLPNDFKQARTVEKSHGRLETRQLTTSSSLQGYADWPGLPRVFRLERTRTNIKTGKVSAKVVYGITSLSAKSASPRRLLQLTRSYWGIENGLHWRRNVTFREDRTRLTQGQAGRVIATLNNLAISLLRYNGHTNIAEARRESNANLNLPLSLLAARSVS